MRFRLNTSNHGSLVGVSDFLLLLRLLIESAGHGCVQDDTAGCHVFVECFKPSDAAAMAKLRKSGTAVVIVATENITGSTFNDFSRAPGSGHYGGTSTWKNRFDNFLLCASHATAIWCPFDAPKQLDAYRALVEVPVVSLPFAHFPKFPRVTHAAKTTDVFFWGTRTKHRDEVMARLKGKYATTFPGFMHDTRRDMLTGQSKICLNLKQYRAWPIPSKMRCWYHLSNASCLVGETCAVPCDLDQYARTVPEAELDDACGELLKSGEWERLAAETYDRFAAECPGKPAAERLLDCTFSRDCFSSPDQPPATPLEPTQA